VTLGVLRHPRWYPLADQADIELRLRDVWTAHSPLTGLYSRLGAGPGREGSRHPGPLGFYAMWPVYRVFGANSWAMLASSVSLHIVAIGAIIATAYRRSGIALVAGITASVAVLTRFYGPLNLTDP